MTEQKLQKKIIDQYESDGYYVLKLSKTNKNGIPDLLCLKKGEMPLFIEVKAKGGKLSELQRYRIKEIKSFGFEAIATSAVDRFYCHKEIQCADQCGQCREHINRIWDL